MESRPAVPEAVSPEFLALQVVVAGRYSLIRELGRGGMGIVFLAREVALDRLVAIKLLPPAVCGDVSLRERFLREARTAAKLSHPHIVPIHAVETTTDCVFFVMEYIPGETLGARIRREGALHAAGALRIAQETAWALGHAHARGVIHRDVKPDNIMLEEGTDRAVVTDFGIAHHGGGHDSAAGHGTMHYMSPEQAIGETVDARSDIYSLGVTLFHAVSGRRPFEGYDGAALLAHQAAGDPPSVRTFAPSLSPAFTAAIDRATRRDRGARWSSMDEMVESLAAARAVVPQLPMPLRRFGREAMDVGRQLGQVLGLTGAALFGGLFIDAFLVTFFDFEIIMYLVVGTLSGFLSLTLLLKHMQGMRSLARRGYGRRAALRAVSMLDTDEAHLAEPIGGPEWSRRPQALIPLSMLLTVAGLLAVSNGNTAPVILGGLTVSLFTPVLAISRLARLKGLAGSWWARVLKSRVGGWLWKAATLGLRPTRESPVGGEPTALAVGEVVRALHAGLSPGEQQLLAEVPDLAERLEARALDRGDPHAAAAMAALETLRLDLLRLRAGQLQAEGVTEDLRKLQEVGLYVDAKDEVG